MNISTTKKSGACGMAAFHIILPNFALVDLAVPNNLYILGTMNSADKSISLKKSLFKHSPYTRNCTF